MPGSCKYLNSHAVQSVHIYILAFSQTANAATTLKAACPDPRMSFPGIPNSQHCGGIVAFVTIATVLSHYWPLLCKVKRRALYFILKNCLTINKKIIKT